MPIRHSVGQLAQNDPGDVKIIQTLLNNNASQLVPATMVSPTGSCDKQTIYLITLFQDRVVGMENPTGQVVPNGRTWFALNGQSGPASLDLDPEMAVDALNSQFLNFAQRFIQDDGVRANYLTEAKKFSQEILDQYGAGELTAAAAAKRAQEMRNSLMETSRLNLSDVGRAVSELEKAAGKSMEELTAHYATKLYGKSFGALNPGEQDAVFIEIVRAAGRANPKWNARAALFGKVGKGLLVVSLAIACYNIAFSDRPGRQTVKEASSLGIGFLGSVGGGAAAGLWCGPGAPVCVGIGAIVGGIVFAVGSDLAFDWLWE
jgi:hypothetical protein